MRGAGLLIAVMLAAGLGLGCGELLAQTKAPAVVTSMSSRPDIAQLQSAAIDWLRATVTSSQFVFGVIVGFVLAEGGRFLLRGLAWTWGIVAYIIGLFIHYRLMAAGALAAVYYLAVYWGPGLGSLTSAFG